MNLLEVGGVYDYDGCLMFIVVGEGPKASVEALIVWNAGAPGLRWYKTGDLLSIMKTSDMERRSKRVA